MNGCINFIQADPNGRCLVFKLNLGQNSILLFNLYLPCIENSAKYRAEIAFYVGFIENILNTVPFSDVIILDDTNFDINDANAGYLLLKPLLLNYNIVHCDDLINNPIQYTYDNTVLGQFSLIDHFFVTPFVRACTSQVLIIDSEANTSDHRPVVLRLQLPPAASPTGSRAINKPVSLKVR